MKEKILALAKETIEQLGFICLEAKISRSPSSVTLKTVIHKTVGNVSTSDCAETANVLQKRLDLEFPAFSEEYDVVVESPGVDRKLQLPDDLPYFLERDIRFVLRKTDKYGIKDNVVVGKAVQKGDKQVQVTLDNGTVKILDIEDISSARIYFDIRKYL